RGPGLNAVIELNPDALDIARELDAEARQGRRRSPMHGIPVLVKDVFATNDAMRATAGSLALADNQSVQDAFMIEALRDAGAIILGKANMTEFSNFRGGTPSGWSSRGGITVNPYITSFSAWGSSTGSAVSVAASYVPLAIGVETDGSILCPASACGVVGLKPTVGLVSRRGSLGISFIQDSPGPIGRTVEDVAYGLSAMVGYDADDMAFDAQFGQFSPASRFASNPVPNVGERDYTRMLDPDGLRGARIGVCRSMFGFDPIVDAHVENALDAMREAGAEIIDDVYMDAVGIVADSVNEGNMLVMEFGWKFQRFLENYIPNGPITSLEDVIAFNYEHPDETLLHGGQEGLEVALTAASVEDGWFEELVSGNVTAARDDGIDLTMDQYNLDALVAPTASLPTSLALDAMRGSSSQVPSMAGYPSLTLPIGYTYGLPAGIHFFGRAFSEQTLIKLAYGLEQTLQARRAPEYLEEPPVDYDLESTPDYYEPEYAYPEGTGEEYPDEEWNDSGEWETPDEWYDEPAEDYSGG
ncbi:MAG TPA: amidase family protein, partial [Thermomicrobiales bacterium]|nr:amidase family protein [Thermomicrobiales bacterium]